ncbi:tetratricopeptide repeat protein [Enterovibrio paralichthyis]|uniref:tetratricopeptide repeat protein n=1 Tax=Enterovibrio paralichthyis TaxID=2853805 RepID=UPI001C4583E6|nr:tetratricopeptide repeat protein [Enterovibrio paralichthyis]MBV7297981.1 MSHA biogenesis protein MshN [Enterovibrio paralichthyis]
MSELNRMLSELTPKQEQQHVATAAIPARWGFRLARVALALFATLAGASGIAWALSAGNGKAVTVAEQPDIAQSVTTPVSLPSPTQKVVSSDVRYVALTPAKEIAPAVIETAMVAAPVEPVVTAKKSEKTAQPQAEVNTVSQAMPKTVSQAEPKAETVVAKVSVSVPETVDVAEASMSVETVEFTGEQLADIAYDKAQKRAKAGDNQKAIAHLRDAVQYNPNHVVATNQLAAMLFGRNQLRDAENVLRKGISANPHSASLKLTLARMYQQSDREESALSVLSVPVESLDGEQNRVIAMRAALAQKLGDNATARESYQWLTTHEPTDGRWWLGLGVSAERSGKHDIAKNAYTQAVQAGGLSAASVKFARDRLTYLDNLKQGAGNGR